MERFARKCVKSGRYNIKRSHPIRTAPAARAGRAPSPVCRDVARTEEEADQNGTFTLENVLAEAKEIIKNPSFTWKPVPLISRQREK